ncbi:uncharacterized protein LOC126081952 isoform X2 [Elephas maximus indicus]|uniref:uncharacterized protein LOC126081952 isoform X2 n=2 Tax=Elephas maximus indicus TaxID=99487 RepID=UPI002116C0A4|nr:uncharacterized protein LOC126081952 isoform X2 [Elephas maximus indicus]
MDLESQKGRPCSCIFPKSLQYSTQQGLNSKWKEKVIQSQQSDHEVNIWEVKPPDFSYKLYTSLRSPGKTSKNLKKERRKTRSNFPETTLHLPSIRNDPKKSTSPQFITTFAHLDSHKAKIMFVKSGKYPSGVYLNPKPHDFRQVRIADFISCTLDMLSGGTRPWRRTSCLYRAHLPNFVTTYERDPFDLKLKSRHLSTVHGCQLLKDNQQKNSTERFITYKPRECTWDSKLILPKDPWPTKSASYTRYQRQRDAYGAFMDRVEEKFTKTHKNRSSTVTISCHGVSSNSWRSHVCQVTTMLHKVFNG